MNVLIVRLETWAHSMHTRLTLMRVAMDELGLPKNLRNRIESFHEYSALNHDEGAMRVLEKCLSSPLLVDLKLTLFSSIILGAPFFDGFNDLSVMMEVMIALQFCLW